VLVLRTTVSQYWFEFFPPNATNFYRFDHSVYNTIGHFFDQASN